MQAPATWPLQAAQCDVVLRGLEREFTCCICLNLLDEPMRLPCDHHMCRKCTQHALDQAARCPVCKAPTTQRATHANAKLKQLTALFTNLRDAVCAALLPTDGGGAEAEPGPPAAEGSGTEDEEPLGTGGRGAIAAAASAQPPTIPDLSTAEIHREIADARAVRQQVQRVADAFGAPSAPPRAARAGAPTTPAGGDGAGAGGAGAAEETLRADDAHARAAFEVLVPASQTESPPAPSGGSGGTGGRGAGARADVGVRMVVPETQMMGFGPAEPCMLPPMEPGLMGSTLRLSMDESDDEEAAAAEEQRAAPHSRAAAEASQAERRAALEASAGAAAAQPVEQAARGGGRSAPAAGRPPVPPGALATAEPSDRADASPLAGSAHSPHEGAEEEEDDECCCVCGAGDFESDNLIVFCSGCDIAVHQGCYGITRVPEGEWWCDLCANGARSDSSVRCAVCPGRKGALKRTLRGRWGGWMHVTCAQYLPALGFVHPETLRDAAGVDKLDRARLSLSCSLCERGAGATGAAKARGRAKATAAPAADELGRVSACVQCSHGRCLAAFHVSCAQQAGYFMEIREDADGCVHNEIFCRKHSELVRAARRRRQRPASARRRVARAPEPAPARTALTRPSLPTHARPSCTPVAANAAPAARRALHPHAHAPQPQRRACTAVRQRSEAQAQAGGRRAMTRPVRHPLTAASMVSRTQGMGPAMEQCSGGRRRLASSTHHAPLRSRSWCPGARRCV